MSLEFPLGETEGIVCEWLQRPLGNERIYFIPRIFETDYKGKMDGRDILSKFFLAGKKLGLF